MAIQARHPALQAVQMPDQGYAPLLAEADVIGRIAKVVAACDRPASDSAGLSRANAGSRRGSQKKDPDGCPPGVGG